MFHKYLGENVAFTNCMSRFSMFVPTKANVKISNGNTGHAQGIGVILCRFPKCSIMYSVGPVYYCPGHSSNNISSVALKFYVGFQKVTSEPHEMLPLLNLRVVLGDHPNRPKTILTILKPEFSKSTLTETGILLSQMSVPYQK